MLKRVFGSLATPLRYCNVLFKDSLWQQGCTARANNAAKVRMIATPFFLTIHTLSYIHTHTLSLSFSLFIYIDIYIYIYITPSHSTLSLLPTPQSDSWADPVLHQPSQPALPDPAAPAAPREHPGKPLALLRPVRRPVTLVPRQCLQPTLALRTAVAGHRARAGQWRECHRD